MDKISLPVAVRISLRYASGALVAKGLLAPEMGAALAADPEVLQLVSVGAGLLIGVATEAAYAVGKRLGWRT